ESLQLLAQWRWERSVGRRSLGMWALEGPAPQILLTIVAGVAAATVLAGTLISSLAPPTEALDVGSPLWSARRLLEPTLHEVSPSSGPLVAIGFAWALALDGPVAAGLLAWVGGLWLLLATYLVAREVLGNRWGAMVGPAMLATPALAVSMSLPLGATALAVWIMLAWHAAQQRRADNFSEAWLVLVGISSGAAIATDARGWLGVAVLLVLVARQSIDWRGWRATVRDFACIASVALLVAGSEYFFACAPWRYWSALDVTPMRPVVGRVFAPLRAVVEQLGPLTWMLVPALAAARRLRGLKATMLLATGLLVAGLMSRQMPLVLAAAGPLTIGAVWSFVEVGRWHRWPRRAVYSLATIALVAGTAIAIEDALPKLSVAAGLESRRDYLLRELPGYRAAQVMNEAFGDHARIWSVDQVGVYLNGNVVAGEGSLGTSINLRDVDAPWRPAAELVSQLRRRDITHALISAPLRGEISDPSRVPRHLRQRAAWWSRKPEAGTGSQTVGAPRESIGADGQSQKSAESPADGVYCVSDYVASDPRGHRHRYCLLLIR
ncbi:MAG: hypothetical protein AB7U73_11270, partial [Pirellulales bacterium]